MEDRKEILARTRNRIFVVKSRRGKSWESVFDKCDKDQSGYLDYNELHSAVRSGLIIPEKVIQNYELRILFDEIDVDGSGGVSIEELLQYLQQGYRTPQEIAAKADVRIQRVRKNLKLAFSGISSNEMSIRKMFTKLDLDGDSSLSLYEFKKFVRTTLSMSTYEITNTDLEDFYKFLDTNGGGISVDELIAFVRNNRLDRPKSDSFLPAIQVGRSHQKRGGVRMKTYKQRLLEDSAIGRSVSLPDLSRLPYTSSIVGLGRNARPMVRLF